MRGNPGTKGDYENRGRLVGAVEGSKRFKMKRESEKFSLHFLSVPSSPFKCQDLSFSSAKKTEMKEGRNICFRIMM